ncbi:hypothetical protein BN133_1025 [Cronobacter dublinensis 582]|nr:hypothetical protein BN133_1025 [Cronobacter dublinensis 582]
MPSGFSQLVYTTLRHRLLFIEPKTAAYFLKRDYLRAPGD